MTRDPHTPPDRGPRLIAVGDLQLGDSPTAAGFGFRSAHADEASMRGWAARVRNLLGEADVVFGNLEGVISDAGLVPHDLRSAQLRGRPFYARFVAEAGFTVVNVANNHCYQHGPEAFAETVRLMEEAGVAVAGIAGNQPWSSRPVILERGTRRVGIVAYCFRPRQYAPETPPYAEGARYAVCADVARLKDEVDTVVVSLHWGEEFVATPSELEMATATAIVAAGADLIIGHHPHVLRGLQRIGDAVVAYSLGNFSGDMIWHEPLRAGGILRCVLGAVVEDARVDPVRIERDHLPRSAGPALTPADRIVPLAEAAYQREVERTVRAQRFDAYGYALRNLHRFPARLLAQLGANTLRNKLGALLGGAGRRSLRRPEGTSD